MNRALPFLLVLLAIAGCRERRVPPAEGQRAAPSIVRLDDAPTQVRWSDGDTFRILSGPHSGAQARLSGYNTLEDYGPVHRWGAWTARELFANAKAAGEYAAAREWSCRRLGEKDHYGRLLVDCPDAARALLKEGLAFAFSMDSPSPEELLEAQREAQRERKGMWAKGVPSGIVSSVHSAEQGDGYNRVVDTRTGASRPRRHQERYDVCQEVCEGEGEDRSCLVHVPFERRYKDRPPCLAGADSKGE